MLWLLQSARPDCQALHLFFYAWTLFSLKSLLCQCTCSEISCLSVVAPDLHQWKSEEHQSTHTLFSWPVWKRVNPNQHTSLAAEAIQYLIVSVPFVLCLCMQRGFFPRLLFDSVFFSCPACLTAFTFQLVFLKMPPAPLFCHLREKAQLHYCSEWMHFLINVAEREII